jgi:hypothetical protein
MPSEKKNAAAQQNLENRFLERGATKEEIRGLLKEGHAGRVAKTLNTRPSWIKWKRMTRLT